MTILLTLRDRPGWFWCGAALVFLGVFLSIMHYALAGTSLREAEIGQIIWAINFVFLAGGGLCMWHGRRVRLDLGRRALIRSDTVVRDLSVARLVVVYQLLVDDPAHYVVLALDPGKGSNSLVNQLGRSDQKAIERLSMAALMGDGDEVFFALAGGPKRVAEPLAQALSKGLGLPMVRAVGDRYEVAAS